MSKLLSVLQAKMHWLPSFCAGFQQGKRMQCNTFVACHHKAAINKNKVVRNGDVKGVCYSHEHPALLS